MNYELQTKDYVGKSISIKTNIGTLKEVWNILKDVKLDGLLTGGSLDLSFNDIVDTLLFKDTLSNFISIITYDLPTQVEDLDLIDIVGIVSLFFTSIAEPFRGLNIALSEKNTATG